MRLRRIDLRGDRGDPSPQLPRASAQTLDDARRSVREILDAVRDEGDAAVARYARQFDGWEPPGSTEGSVGGSIGGSSADSGAGAKGVFEIGLDEAKAALDSLDAPLRSALERAADQVRWFHERARPHDWEERRGGALLGVRHQPLRRVGVYVPGGRGAYPSTVLMTVVPAKVAGVDEIVLCTPPDADGRVNETILAAAALVGADRLFRIGGAQAIGAMAYGTASVPRCDKVVGPGNVFVSTAKQLAASDGVIGIDALAGVTEVAIIADHTADARLVAADLVAQAEHDPLATCLLISCDAGLADRVETALDDEVARTRHRTRVETALAGQGAVVLVEDLDQAVEVANAFAAEHLEVQTADAPAVARRIRAAGAIFVGATTPVSLGDYCAGPNHTLPTGGTARFTGGLRTDDFFVPVNWVEYDQAGLADLAPVVAQLSAAEDLPAHNRAVQVRLDGGM